MQLKAICIKHLQDYVAGFQERRSKVTEATVNEFMSTRPLEWKGNPKIPRAELVVPMSKDDGEEVLAGGDGNLSKNQQKKLLKQQSNRQKKVDKAKEKEDRKTESAAE